MDVALLDHLDSLEHAVTSAASCTLKGATLATGTKDKPQPLSQEQHKVC